MNKTLIFSLILFCQTCLAEDIYIDLKSTAPVDSKLVYLGDVANLVCNNPVQLELFSKLAVKRLDSLVLNTKITKDEIEKLASEKLFGFGGSIIWSNVNTSEVTGRQDKIDLTEGMDAIAFSLLDKAKLKPLKLMLSNIALPEVRAPKANIEQKPVIKEARWGHGKVSVPLRIYADGHLIAKPVLHFILLQADSLASEVKQNNEPKLSLIDEAEVKHVYATTESIGSAEKKSLVEKNQIVRILLYQAGLEIESEGVALSNAGLGERVRVKRLKSSSIFVGRVQDSGVVLLEGG